MFMNDGNDNLLMLMYQPNSLKGTINFMYVHLPLKARCLLLWKFFLLLLRLC